MLHRPIAIFGHMTSLCLEEEVWQWLHEIATATKMSRRQLIERIAAGKGRRSLASACRIYVAAHFAGDDAVFRSAWRLVRARDGGLHVLSPRHASVTHIH
jgi:predicted DNA-binding ribbon-helix-helix protein